jgi:hypothetical protein
MANDDRYAIVPSDLKLCALDLSAIGANELAWHRQDCLDVLKVLHDHGQAVLGGDVYEIKDQKPIPSYDNWFARERRLGESWPDYVRYTCNIGVDYVRTYREGKRTIAYVPVFVSENQYLNLAR